MRGSKIEKRGNSYSFRYDLPTGPDGKRRQKTETVKGSYRDAERRQREILSQIDQGQFSWTPIKKTLAMFLTEYLENIQGGNASTYSSYVCAFNSFRKCLGDTLLLTDLTTVMVQKAVNDFSGKIDKSTVELYFIKFKAALNYACSPGIHYLTSNPCTGVILNKPDFKEKLVWDDDQANLFIRFCRSSTLRYTTLFVLLLKTGARVGEILALRWTDVDDTGVIHVTRTATKWKSYNPPKSRHSIRKIPIDQGTLKMMLKHKLRQGKEKLLHGEGYNSENLVFSTRTGSRVIYQGAYRAFIRMAKRAGLPYITIHGLRHTHATFLLRHGHSVNSVAERLGDNPETIMNTYAHVLPGMQAEVVKTIELLYE